MGFPSTFPLLLDGATGTYFLSAGMPAGVCMEQWICEHPQMLRDLHREYIAAGAQAVYAPTFGANAQHLSEYGLREQVDKINRTLVRITKETAEPLHIPVGGSLCPTGLFVPPYGESDFDDIYDIYREQVRALEEAGVDFLAIETQTSLADMRAAVLAARTTNLPIFVTATLDSSGHTMTGCGLLPMLITMQAMGVDAVGLNCCDGPSSVIEPLQEAIVHASIPLIAKPSAGLPRHGYLSPEEFAMQMLPVLKTGVSMVGGCCGTTPAHIAQLRRILDEFRPQYQGTAVHYEDADNYAAAMETEVFFLGDDIMLSEPITCSSGLSDDLIDLEDEQVNAALVLLQNMDDVHLLTENSTVTRIPIAIHTDSRTLLDAALRYFQGRLIIDSNCEIDMELIERIASKYGAIVY